MKGILIFFRVERSSCVDEGDNRDWPFIDSRFSQLFRTSKSKSSHDVSFFAANFRTFELITDVHVDHR